MSEPLDGWAEKWPVELRGVTESIVTTLGPNGRWNVAALGIHAPGHGARDSEEPTDSSKATDRRADTTADGRADTTADGRADTTADGNSDITADATERSGPTEPIAGSVTARTYGRTRTWRNFSERGGGYVQFTADPRAFVDAALTIQEVDAPVLPSTDAWVEVRADRIDERIENDTRIGTWGLTPIDQEVRRKRVPTINRGFGAVIDATVAASRLDVDGFETDVLLDRLTYFGDVVERCGGPRERDAFARIDAATGWRSRVDGSGENRSDGDRIE